MFAQHPDPSNVVAGHGRLGQFTMFRGGVGAARGGQPDGLEALRLIQQLGDMANEALVRARRHEGQVKGAVDLVHRNGHGRPAQGVEGRRDLGGISLTTGATVCGEDRPAESLGIHQQAHLVQLDRLGEVEGRHTGATLGFDHHETLAGQTHEGLAQWGGRYAELLGEVLGPQTLPGSEIAVEDGAAKAGIHPLGTGQRARGHTPSVAR